MCPFCSRKRSFSYKVSLATPAMRCRWGLLLSVLDGHHEDFRGFLAYYSAHVNSHGLMQWQQVSRGGRIYTESASQSCATDADLDAAYALLLAGDDAHAAVGDQLTCCLSLTCAHACAQEGDGESESTQRRALRSVQHLRSGASTRTRTSPTWVIGWAGPMIELAP